MFGMGMYYCCLVFSSTVRENELARAGLTHGRNEARVSEPIPGVWVESLMLSMMESVVLKSCYSFCILVLDHL